MGDSGLGGKCSDLNHLHDPLRWRPPKLSSSAWVMRPASPPRASRVNVGARHRLADLFFGAVDQNNAV